LDAARQPPAPARWKSDVLRIRLRDNGSAWCRLTQVGRRVPPYFRGQLREEDGGVVLEGVIRESRMTGLVTSEFSIVTVIMAAAAIACVAVSPIIVPGLVICGLAAVAFGLLSVPLRKQRVARFAIEANELDGKVRERFDAAG
jgi:hypothetical protein